jgi:hypothetical protein
VLATGGTQVLEDAYEELVRWYLRFNGYLYVENFIVHEPNQTSTTVPQGAEIDILAVRFAFSRELIPGGPGKEILRHECLAPPVRGMIDFVIAEVKSKEKIQLNKIWRNGDQEPYRRRVEYLVRWLGCFSMDDTIASVSSDLLRTHHARRGRYSFRVILFAKRSNPQNLSPNIRVITFEDILWFVVHNRANSWAQIGLGTRSQHSQWSALIRDLWSIADSVDSGTEIERVRRMNDLLLATSQARRISGSGLV